MLIIFNRSVQRIWSGSLETSVVGKCDMRRLFKNRFCSKCTVWKLMLILWEQVWLLNIIFLSHSLCHHLLWQLLPLWCGKPTFKKTVSTCLNDMQVNRVAWFWLMLTFNSMNKGAERGREREMEMEMDEWRTGKSGANSDLFYLNYKQGTLHWYLFKIPTDQGWSTGTPWSWCWPSIIFQRIRLST